MDSNSRPAKQPVYASILNDLIAGRWRPGTHLSTDSLARQLGVSRMPVREAITRLHQEGLLEHKENVGAFVRPITIEDWLEIHDLREPLETLAAGRAARRATPAQIETLRRCCEEYSAVIQAMRARGLQELDDELSARFGAADMLFDHTIMTAAGNRRAVIFVDELHRMAQVLMGAIKNMNAFMTYEEALQQHREITEAIASRNSKAAKRAMRNHSRFAKRRYLASQKAPV